MKRNSYNLGPLEWAWLSFDQHQSILRCPPLSYRMLYSCFMQRQTQEDSCPSPSLIAVTSSPVSGSSLADTFGDDHWACYAMLMVTLEFCALRFACRRQWRCRCRLVGLTEPKWDRRTWCPRRRLLRKRWRLHCFTKWCKWRRTWTFCWAWRGLWCKTQ